MAAKQGLAEVGKGRGAEERQEQIGKEERSGGERREDRYSSSSYTQWQLADRVRRREGAELPWQGRLSLEEGDRRLLYMCVGSAISRRDLSGSSNAHMHFADSCTRCCISAYWVRKPPSSSPLSRRATVRPCKFGSRLTRARGMGVPSQRCTIRASCSMLTAPAQRTRQVDGKKSFSS